ncbi:DNA/RNA nuclease SfsA [Lacticaseibacillus daqingensis]|uniref:DNA/RNA nuclease SfsA n=1 Tax=Lacticaseibacillus daqingensis TaxID=2486014 RepID=UPI000F778D2C|nr:DNA/RNA nuclease SfsA [Lacticaseibacillus daqingensis]
MQYANVELATVIKRVSRFTVMVELAGQAVAAHLSNTGRNKELLIPGHAISVRKAANPARQTPYDILAVKRDHRWINIDSLAPNRVVNAALREGSLQLPGCVGPYTVHPETRYLDSRLDFAGHSATGQAWFAETKGVTLANARHAAFPDAPTTRGLKHVHTLTQAANAGYLAYLLLVVQLPGIDTVTIYHERFPELAPAITAAKAAGVQVVALGCQTGPDYLALDRPIAFDETLPFTEVAE